MKNSILVVDDQITDRRKDYEHLAKEISLIAPGVDIELVFIEHPNELPIKMSDSFSGVIVDAVLSDNWENFDIWDTLTSCRL